MGIKRSKQANGPSALKKILQSCQEKNIKVEVIQTDLRYGKGDSWTPQKEGDKIMEVIQSFQKNRRFRSIIVEMSSMDEFYIDVTKEVQKRSQCSLSYWRSKGGLRAPRSVQVQKLTSELKTNPNAKYFDKPVVCLEGAHRKQNRETLEFKIVQIYGNENEKLDYHDDEIPLVHGAVIAQEIVQKIRKDTGYIASVGIGTNKLIAKLACDINKPEGITILPNVGFHRLARTTFLFTKLPGFTSKKGEELEQVLAKENPGTKLTLKNVGNLDVEYLIKKCQDLKWPQYQNDVVSLIDKCHGVDNAIVVNKFHKDVLSTSLSFKGFYTPKTTKQFLDRAGELCMDIFDRIKYNRDMFRRQVTSLTSTIELKAKFKVDSEDGQNTSRDMQVNQNTSFVEIQNFLVKHIKDSKLDKWEPTKFSVEKIILRGEKFGLLKKQKN